MAGTRRSRKQSIVKTKKRIYGTGKIAKAGADFWRPIVASAFAKSKEKTIKKLTKAKKVKQVLKKETKPVVWRNSKLVGRTRVANKLRSRYDPKTDQWIKKTN